MPNNIPSKSQDKNNKSHCERAKNNNDNKKATPTNYNVVKNFTSSFKPNSMTNTYLNYKQQNPLIETNSKEDSVVFKEADVDKYSNEVKNIVEVNENPTHLALFEKISEELNVDDDNINHANESADGKESVKREKWASKTEFLLSGLGYCIGIGNVWRFPYLCYRSGGGAFFIPYLIMLFFCGIPLFFMETSLGQFSSTGCLTLFRISPLFKGAGMAIVVVNVIVTTYFVTLFSYPLLFLGYCFNYVLPWSECNNHWNTPKCVQLGAKQATFTLDALLNSSSNVLSAKTSADEFFNNEILRTSPSIEDTGGIVWPLFIWNLVAWALTYLCISNGVKTVGKVVYFTATFPFVILFILLVRGLTLPGAWEGVKFYIYPQWDQLTNFKIWADAAVQIFYSLGPGWGGIVNMASYNNFNNNVKWDSVFIAVCNCGTSIFAGFVVFSVLGFMSNQTGLPVSSVATGGPGLAFITYPEAISMLPWPNFWAILFFLMLFFLGLDSAFVGIEAIVTSITDKYTILRKYKKTVIFCSCVFMWLMSIIFTTNSGIYWLTLIDYYAASFSVVCICLVEVLIVGWIYGVKNFVSDIEFMIKEKVSWVWIVLWKFTSPLILFVVFAILISYNTKASYDGQTFPDWAIDIGWMSCFASVIWIPIYMGYHLLYVEQGDLVERFKTAVSADVKWGPADSENRIKWIAHNATRRHYLKQVVRDKDQRHQEFIQLCST